MANRLQERRLALGLTQPQVSARLKEVEARADVGMVSRYEKGVCLPTEAQLAALEGVLQADRLELFDAEDLDLLGALRARGEDQGPPNDSEKKVDCFRESLLDIRASAERVNGLARMLLDSFQS